MSRELKPGRQVLTRRTLLAELRSVRTQSFYNRATIFYNLLVFLLGLAMHLKLVDILKKISLIFSTFFTTPV
jgi:hypothetical protein